MSENTTTIITTHSAGMPDDIRCSGFRHDRILQNVGSAGHAGVQVDPHAGNGSLYSTRVAQAVVTGHDTGDRRPLESVTG